ncbi:hypothetical protein GCM10010399_73000 [Dactylosporangium fulvum]|uniref:Uncharacterized protein n=1 Tax=Dactylosporangium fulvum TaxID=53359 RepID=A0ABY5W8N6_9ACTN|nr:hypothetical protein [Dactylosporangium fulvum]UWP85725.1 hypothetical protein Dfulv_16380 [Dactylosporangium fulvum]
MGAAGRATGAVTAVHRDRDRPVPVRPDLRGGRLARPGTAGQGLTACGSIAIIGAGGAGTTVLANRLGRLLDLPGTHLDARTVVRRCIADHGGHAVLIELTSHRQVERLLTQLGEQPARAGPASGS